MTTIIKMALQQNEKIFFFNGEQTKDDFKNNLYKQMANKANITQKQYKQSQIFDSYVTDEEAQKLGYKYNGMLYLYNNEAKRDINTILYAMLEVHKLYGVKVFILDNFMQIDIRGSDLFQEQSNIMEQIRQFAVNNEVHVHLVAHPRKLDRGQSRIGIEDISGTMNMANKAYNIVSIIRVDLMDKDSGEYKYLAEQLLKARYDINETSTILEVIKQKGNGNGVVGLVFDPQTRSFTQQSQITSEKYEQIRREFNMNKNNKNNPFGR